MSIGKSSMKLLYYVLFILQLSSCGNNTVMKNKNNHQADTVYISKYFTGKSDNYTLISEKINYYESDTIFIYKKRNEDEHTIGYSLLIYSTNENRYIPFNYTLNMNKTCISEARMDPNQKNLIQMSLFDTCERYDAIYSLMNSLNKNEQWDFLNTILE